MSHPEIKPLILVILITVGILGCDEDRRLVEMARESSARQAEQNRQMAEVTRHAAEATRKVVEANTNLDRQRQDLDGERRQIAAQRHRDPLIAAAISSTAILLACLLPLVLAIYMLRCATKDPGDEAQLAELLILEMTSDKPLLLEHLPAPKSASGAAPSLPPSQTR